MLRKKRRRTKRPVKDADYYIRNGNRVCQQCHYFHNGTKEYLVYVDPLDNDFTVCAAGNVVQPVTRSCAKFAFNGTTRRMKPVAKVKRRRTFETSY